MTFAGRDSHLKRWGRLSTWQQDNADPCASPYLSSRDAKPVQCVFRIASGPTVTSDDNQDRDAEAIADLPPMELEMEESMNFVSGLTVQRIDDAGSEYYSATDDSFGTKFYRGRVKGLEATTHAVLTMAKSTTPRPWLDRLAVSRSMCVCLQMATSMATSPDSRHTMTYGFNHRRTFPGNQ
eukprot:scaffold4737_cov371-Prasinococcus_capsulatus_cf.AAC.2